MATATLTTLTPVHIGSGQKLLRDFDFVVQDGKLGIIDLEKVVKIIGIEQIAQLTAVIEKRGSIIDFLKKGRGQQQIKLADICSRISDYKAAGSKASELKEHYHASLKGVCIPGSSLKGAIKTAIWEYIADTKQADWQQKDYGLVKENIDKTGRVDKKLVKFFDSFIEKKLFGPNANEKTTRFLKIGDIHFTASIPAVFEVGIYNAGYDNWDFKNGQSFLAECIAAQSVGNFEIKLDHEWLSKNITYYPQKWTGLFTGFISNGTTSFCSLINNYTSKQLGFEISDLEDNGFGDEYEGEEMLNEVKRIKRLADDAILRQKNIAIIRVGGNSGWNFTTGGWVKASSLNNEDYGALRRSIQRGKSYNMDLWPKTRKMTMAGLPMGFVKISFDDEKKEG